MYEMQEQSRHELEDPIKDNLVCHQEISLRWHKVERVLSDSQLMALQNENLKLMEVLVSGEDAIDIEQQRDREVFKEIRKLDAKLNLMMSWLGQILRHQQDVPQPQSVYITTKGLQFFDNEVIAENDELFMELFLDPRYPQAFTTLAQVVHCNPQQQGQEVSVRFIHLDEQNQQWLDKYVFRLHRRQVAMARKNPPPFAE